MIRVIIVDDHRIYREGLATALTAHGVLIDALASTGPEAVTLARDLRPDVVLMDSDLVLVGGLVTIRTISAQRSSKCVLILSRDAEPHSISEAMKAGASGYVLPQAGITDLVKIIHACSRGEQMSTPNSGGVKMASMGRAFGERARLPADVSTLSHREQTILDLVVRGSTNDEIAHALHISVNTVKVYLKQLFEKLGVQNRTQAAVFAVKCGLFEDIQNRL